jgi:hypothetical protein
MENGTRPRDPARGLFIWAQSYQQLSSWPCGGNVHKPHPAQMPESAMSPTVAECLEHARQCEWYAARTADEADRKFLLWRAQEWTKLAEEKEREEVAQTAA